MGLYETKISRVYKGEKSIIASFASRIEMLQMKEDETVNSYFARTLKIAKSMKACEERMRENIIAAKILRSMIPKFNYVVCLIEASNNLDTMTIDR